MAAILPTFHGATHVLHQFFTFTAILESPNLIDVFSHRNRPPLQQAPHQLLYYVPWCGVSLPWGTCMRSRLGDAYVYVMRGTSINSAQGSEEGPQSPETSQSGCHVLPGFSEPPQSISYAGIAMAFLVVRSFFCLAHCCYSCAYVFFVFV